MMKTRIKVLIGLVCLIALSCKDEDESIIEDAPNESAKTSITMLSPKASEVFAFAYGEKGYPLTQTMIMVVELKDLDGLAAATFVVKNNLEETVYKRDINLSYLDAVEHTLGATYTPDLIGDYVIQVIVTDGLGNEELSELVPVAYK